MSGLSCLLLRRSLQSVYVPAASESEPDEEPLARAVGFRVEPNSVHWAVTEGTSEAPVLLADDRFAAPATFSEAQALSWYRERVLLLLKQYEPAGAGIKYTEQAARARAGDSSRTRSRIEGVILEALHSAGLTPLTGTLVKVSARLESDSAKKYLENNDLRGIRLDRKTPARKDAILMSVAALEG